LLPKNTEKNKENVMNEIIRLIEKDYCVEFMEKYDAHMKFLCHDKAVHLRTFERDKSAIFVSCLA
jgi:hypothetical protein